MVGGVQDFGSHRERRRFYRHEFAFLDLLTFKSPEGIPKFQAGM